MDAEALSESEADEAAFFQGNEPRISGGHNSDGPTFRYGKRGDAVGKRFTGHHKDTMTYGLYSGRGATRESLPTAPAKVKYPKPL